MEVKMDNVSSAILALIVGILIGVAAILLINHIKSASAVKKASKFLEDAKNEADKHKRDTLLELKKELNAKRIFFR